jgi:hypothetical protein
MVKKKMTTKSLKKNFQADFTSRNQPCVKFSLLFALTTIQKTNPLLQPFGSPTANTTFWLYSPQNVLKDTISAYLSLPFCFSIVSLHPFSHLSLLHCPCPHPHPHPARTMKKNMFEIPITKLGGAFVTFREFRIFPSRGNNKMGDTFCLEVHHFDYIGSEGSPPVSETIDCNEAKEVKLIRQRIQR